MQGRLLSVNNPIARGLGAEELEPEKSVNFGLGFTAQFSDTSTCRSTCSASTSTIASPCPNASTARA